MADIDTDKSSTKSMGQEKEFDAGEVKGGRNGYLRIFSYADGLSWALYGVSLICIIGAGTCLPLMEIIFGKFITVFTKFGTGEMSPAEFRSEVGKWALYFIYLFVAKFVLGYIWTTLISIAAMRTTAAVRTTFVETTLRQDIAFFDAAKSGSAATQVATNGNLIQQGVSEKLGAILQGISTIVACFIVAFASQWKLTLITIAIVPTLILVTSIGFAGIAKKENDILPIYSRAGLLAEEVISSMRTVHAFWAHPKLTADYAAYLEQARKIGMTMSIWYSILFCADYFCIFAGYGLAFWQGIRRYASGEISEPGAIITVIFAVILAATTVTSTIPQVLILTKSVSAAEELFQTIDRPSAIDPLAETGERPTECIGSIEVSDIEFSYPSRPDAKVLKGLSIHIPAGKTTALVGASGSGKSTIIGLLERWYLPTSGSIYLDGKEISKLNIQWLRTQMRLVQQEPVLFAGTIFQNVANGLIGTPHVHASHEEKMRLVEEACRAAYAHDFIVDLPEGYDTQIGERAAMLSGGQKQRIAIARSIVSDPKILLLDEATSALDPKAEKIVQEALDNVSTGRTTITIAHKLSTIKNADNIIVMSNGMVVEQGTHNDLIAAGGAYMKLVKAQDLGHGRPETPDDDSDGGTASAMIGVAQLDRSATTKSAVSAMPGAIEEEKESANYSLAKIIGIIFKENKPLRTQMLIILLTSIIGGLTFPVLAFLFARAMDVFQLPPSKMVKDGDFYSLMFLVVAIVNMIIYLILGWVSNAVAQNLTFNFRLEMFKNVIKQDMAFFDRPNNSTGALVSKLSTQPTQLHELMSLNLSLIIFTIINVISTSILSIAVGWKLGLVVVFGALVPLVFCGWFRVYLDMRLDEAISHRASNSAALAAEAISAMRTVSSLTLERNFLERYKAALKDIERVSIKSVMWAMIWYSLSQSISFLCMCLGFWYGGRLLSTGEYSTTQFFLVFIGVVLSGESAAGAFLFSTSVTKGHSAANYIMWLRTIIPNIRESDDPSGFHNEKRPTGGADVSCHELHFSYPSRPKKKILRGVSTQILPGQFAAFVGASGCGKTTMIALLERFYDPTSGVLTVDDQDITTLCPRRYRREIALVQQEPTLYQGTIRENIAIGLEADAASATDAQIDEACRQANIFTFVSSLPEGLNTMCGARGSQLSGGQKQRIAIARALIRNPRLLLLDEATSALDTESERIVQEALEKAAEGRTTIAVAHRLSTIKHADKILVFEKGKIVETGTHDELVAKNGIYYEMCQGQSLDQPV